MDDLVHRLLQLTPEERLELARQAASELSGLDEDDVVAAWRRALERRFGDEAGQLPLLDQHDGA
jgi:hypothetical protein